MSSNPLENLINTVNKLQDAFTLLGYDPLNLPQICVVGGQSSGKSSVLENIVGRDFLPRGSGIVTRRPLVIQLIYTPDSTQDYGVFLHKMGQPFSNFEEIRKEIASATDQETGTNRGISDKPINLKIYSKNVMNLTLVDLPGITRVAVGDQPPDIEQQIRKMILKYITQKNAIILAVTAANTDLTNSDALQLARDVDPEGFRTIGVITKVDIMDRGTNAMDVLEGNVIPLRLGYVAVINRAQEDIDKGKNINAQWKSEKDYFESHPVYRKIAERCGTTHLTRVLNKNLIMHIRQCLPEMSAKISSFLNEKRDEFTSMAEISEPVQRQKVVLRALTGFADDFQDLLDGNSEHAPSTELFGGARIAYIFNNEFARKVNKITLADKVSDQEIRTTIKNCIGMRGGLFIPDQSFEVVVKRVIKSLDDPCKECVQSVFEELQTIISSIATNETNRFNTLHARIQESARGLLVKCLEPTKELVQTLIKMELSRVNTSHPDFLGSRTTVGGVINELRKEAEDRQRKKESNGSEKAGPTSGAAPPTPGQVTPSPSSTNLAAAGAPPAPATPGAVPAPGQPAAVPGQAGAPQPPVRKLTPAGAAPPPPPPSLKKAPRPGGRTTLDDEPFTDQDVIEAEVIRRLLTSYFDIIRKKIVDSVPKAITLTLVNRFREELHDMLVADLYKEDLIDKLLDESPEIAARRTRCREVVALLEASLRAINDVQASLAS